MSPPRNRMAAAKARKQALRQRLRLLIHDACFIDPAGGAPAGATAQGPFWDLDPTPVILSVEEWSRLEAGLLQRARFTNALLVDLYDRQSLLNQGLVPPEVILGDPYYRRQCLHLEPNRSNPANLLRFDLVRTAKGWTVVQTRVNTAAGLSYAVQNRRFMNQEAGEFYRGLPDHHSIIDFPLQLLDTLRDLAPGGIDSPSIVILTSGPHDPFYNEHSYLARKMGLPLARGDDFLVVDNRVYFKTIAGLKQVDVIYRRLDTAHIDPVVFETDVETAGIPGLVQCIRSGNVAIANAIGVGVAESRALDVWLPRLMRYYLGEKPLLPSVATYTCGDIDQLDYILSRLPSLSILPAHDPRLGDPRLHRPPVLHTDRHLVPEVLGNPFAYVAQEAPQVLAADPTNPNSPPVCLSAFVLAKDKELTVLPGGLVRLRTHMPPLDRVGVTTDLVVLRQPGSPGTVRPQEAGEDLEPVQPSLRPPLGSHTAETLFWLGRYLERAEATARMLAIIDDVALEEIPSQEQRRWVPLWQGLLEATGHGARPEATARKSETLTAGDLSWRMTLDARHASSVYSSVTSAIFNARKLRDFVSPEAWSILHHLHHRLESLRRQAGRVRPPQALPQTRAAVSAVLHGVNAFLGTARRTMLHDAGWHFLIVGTHLERATTTCGALRHVLEKSPPAELRATGSRSPGGSPELSALLRMLGSQDAYRRLYQTRSQIRLVADFFLRQPEAPRSLEYNLDRIETALTQIDPDSNGSGPVRAAVDRLLGRLRRLDPARDFAPDPATTRALDKLLEKISEELEALHPLLSDHFFTHHARVPAPVRRSA